MPVDRTSGPVSLPRIGVLGGTFDPPHEGHLLMARRSIERLGLDEVVFVPVRSPSHKADATAPFQDRFEMVRLLIAGQPGMSVSDIELSLGEKSYTVPMLEALRRQRGSAVELFFIVGADSLAQFHLWYRYQDILRLAVVVAFSRPGYPLQNPNLTAAETARVVVIDDLDCALASRDFREGRTFRLPDTVAKYVECRGLYGT